jgi:hypothetical protein
MRLSFLKRPGCVLFGALFAAALLLPTARANTIDASLNVLYDMADPMNGGTWSLVAKSDPAMAGIFSLNLRLVGVETITPVAPIGTVNGDDEAGFGIFVDGAFDDHRNVVIAQTAQPAGTLEQSLFYGVGTQSDGAPDYPGKPPMTNSIGPMFNTLTNVQNVPWAITPTMPGIFDTPEWATAATFLTGTFIAGQTPGFYSLQSSTGFVFSSVGTPTMAGPLLHVSPLTSTIVRTNLPTTMGDADYNNDGFVNAADYTVWRNTVGTAGPDADGTGPGGVPDGIVDQLDFQFWKDHYGETVPGSGAVSGDSNVPEPATALLLALAALLAPVARTSVRTIAVRRPGERPRRPQSHAKN